MKEFLTTGEDLHTKCMVCSVLFSCASFWLGTLFGWGRTEITEEQRKAEDEDDGFE